VAVDGTAFSHGQGYAIAVGPGAIAAIGRHCCGAAGLRGFPPPLCVRGVRPPHVIANTGG